jgi:hypothetical protein
VDAARSAEGNIGVLDGPWDEVGLGPPGGAWPDICFVASAAAIVRSEGTRVNVGQLIDGIVRQTTVLIGQVSTAAGLRAPLSHVADQVFYELAREIEAQGVRRKVVADMFGLALRTYQKKIQRLSESASARDRTLWEATLDFIRDESPVSRKRIEQRFAHDPQPDLAAVLQDLVSSGLVYNTGRGADALFGITSEADRAVLVTVSDRTALAHLVWITVYRQRTMPLPALLQELRVDRETVQPALDELIGDGRVTVEEEDGEVVLRAPRMLIPVGAEQGWEVAVFDHYTALCAAIAAKLRIGKTKSASSDVIGGATLRFDVHDDHPFAAEVYALLAETRARLNEVWQRVSTHNREHGLPAERTPRRVTFYFGQYVEDPPNGGNESAEDPEVQS